VPVDLHRAMQREAGAVLGATLQCIHCESTSACDAWLAMHEEGEGSTPPRFCPNRGFICSLASKAQ
jgi:hypothetical protein